MTHTTEPAIVVSNLSKKYRLFDSARDRVKEALHPFSKRYHREFWALQGLSFEVPRGQTVGILGRNGSGKSTLLQIIAGVVQPTGGDVIVNGRISALLELGAGFHPEFTGRENVVFQAQVLGLTREEIGRRLPAIETFADIGDFFDQPVRTYSSGMFVRVAFAAAINVAPDILLIDEALAVGDAKFQHKCFQAFRTFSDSGRTLVIVSHDVATLLRLCDSGIVVESGKIDFNGVIAKAANRYQDLLFGNRPLRTGMGHLPDSSERKSTESAAPHLPNSRAYTTAKSVTPRPIPLAREGTEDNCARRNSYNKDEMRLGNGCVRILDFALCVSGKCDPAVIPFCADLSIYVKLYFTEDMENVSIGFAVTSKDGVYVHGTNMSMQGKPLLSGVAGETVFLKLDWCPALVGGDYFLNLGCTQVSAQQDIYLDVRRSIAHLRLEDTPWCTGLVAVASGIEEVARIREG